MAIDDTYITLSSPSAGQYRDRGSRFIALAYPVTDEESVKTILAQLRREYHDATHHCYAWILGHDKSLFRMNDGGEPAGSAGRPIFGQIQSRGLTDILVVVIRYFGGTKLGIPGLINAYRSATADALSHAGIITKIIHDVYEIMYDYPAMNEVMKIMKEEHTEVRETHFEMTCRMVFAVRKNNSGRVTEKLSRIRNLRLHFLSTQ